MLLCFTQWLFFQHLCLPPAAPQDVVFNCIFFMRHSFLSLELWNYCTWRILPFLLFSISVPVWCIYVGCQSFTFLPQAVSSSFHRSISSYAFSTACFCSACLSFVPRWTGMYFKILDFVITMEGWHTSTVPECGILRTGHNMQKWLC